MNILLYSIFFVFLLFKESYAVEENSLRVNIKRYNTTDVNKINRPSSEYLYSVIRDGRSHLTEKFLIEVADLIKMMDEAHVAELLNANVNVAPLPVNRNDVSDSSSEKTRNGSDSVIVWINNKTQSWPKLAPVSERGIYSALDMQVEMLDLILWHRDEQLAEQLRQSRMRIRIRDKSESLFGDFRDVFVETLAEKLCHISELQEALGALGKLGRNFFKNVKSSNEMEKILLKKIRYVAQKSLKIKKD